MGTKLGRSQPIAGPMGRPSRALTSFCRISYPPEATRERARVVKMPFLPCRNVPSGFLGVTRRVNSRTQVAKTRSWRDCTESHQSEINRKIQANDQLRKILTNMPEEYRVLIHGDSFKAKMQSLDDEKSVLQAAKRQFLPLQSRSRRNTRNVWKYCKNGLRLTRNWKQPTPNRPMPNTRRRCWWPNRLQKLPKLSIKEFQGFRLTRHRSVLSMQSMGCHSVAEQLMAAGAR